MICGCGKNPKGLMWVTESWRTPVEPDSLLDFTWLNQARQKFLAWKLGLEKYFKGQTAAAISRWTFQVYIALYLCPLLTWGAIFSKWGLHFWERRHLCILIASCKNQVARASGFWSLAKQTYKSWQPRHPESEALKDPSLFIYRELAFADWADLSPTQQWKDCVCVTLFPLLLPRAVINT